MRGRRRREFICDRARVHPTLALGLWLRYTGQRVQEVFTRASLTDAGDWIPQASSYKMARKEWLEHQLGLGFRA
jgi:hypothetical protein